MWCNTFVLDQKKRQHVDSGESVQYVVFLVFQLRRMTCCAELVLGQQWEHVGSVAGLQGCVSKELVPDYRVQRDTSITPNGGSVHRAS